jgi:hypothetical protein
MFEEGMAECSAQLLLDERGVEVFTTESGGRDLGDAPALVRAELRRVRFGAIVPDASPKPTIPHHIVHVLLMRAPREILDVVVLFDVVEVANDCAGKRRRSKPRESYNPMDPHASTSAADGECDRHVSLSILERL